MSTILQYAEKFCNEYKSKAVAKRFLPPTLFIMMQEDKTANDVKDVIFENITGYVSNPEAIKATSPDKLKQALDEFDGQAHLFGRNFRLNVCIIDDFAKMSIEKHDNVRKTLDSYKGVFGGWIRTVTFFKTEEASYANIKTEEREYVKDLAMTNGVILLGDRREDGYKIGGSRMIKEHGELIAVFAFMMEQIAVNQGIFCMGKSQMENICEGYYMKALKMAVDGITLENNDDEKRETSWSDVVSLIRDGYKKKELSPEIMSEIISNECEVSQEASVETIISKKYGQSIDFYIANERRNANMAKNQLAKDIAGFADNMSKQAKKEIIEKATEHLNRPNYNSNGEFVEYLFNDPVISKVYDYFEKALNNVEKEYINACLNEIKDIVEESIKDRDDNINYVMATLEKMRSEITNYLSVNDTVEVNNMYIKPKAFSEEAICQSVYEYLTENADFIGFIKANSEGVLKYMKRASLPYCTAYSHFDAQTSYLLVGPNNLINDVNTTFVSEMSFTDNVMINISRAII